ncbi:MAG: hypothetical protein GY851_17365 [bacterium]|nr:hypothetical protein [bacterium]
MPKKVTKAAVIALIAGYGASTMAGPLAGMVFLPLSFARIFPLAFLVFFLAECGQYAMWLRSGDTHALERRWLGYVILVRIVLGVALLAILAVRTSG